MNRNPFIFSITCLAMVAMVIMVLGAAAPRYLNTPDLGVRNATDTPAIKVFKTGTQTANLIEIYNPSGTLKHALPATGILPVTYGGTGAASAAAAKTALGIQTGSVTTSSDHTVTNTFATAFSSAPVLVIAQQGEACTVTNNVVSLTASNFVFNAGAPSIVAKWVAVGAP